MLIKLGSTLIKIEPGHTTHFFSDGHECHGDHAGQPGQAERAAELGYASASAMNREHDVAHSLLAHWLGLTHSPTLYGMAVKKPSRLWKEEEAAVLALQRYARSLGIDLVNLARSHGQG